MADSPECGDLSGGQLGVVAAEEGVSVGSGRRCADGEVAEGQQNWYGSGRVRY